VNVPITVANPVRSEAVEKYYAELNVPIVVVVSAARSEALEKYYSQLNIPLVVGGAIVSAAWSQPLVEVDTPASMVSSARSTALADYYAELNIPIVANSSIRSAALAKYYAELNVPSANGFQQVVACSVPDGTLADNPELVYAMQREGC